MHTSLHDTRLRNPWGLPRRAAAALLVVLIVSATTTGGVAAAAPSTPATTVTGTVTWHGGPDDRGTLGVGACPADEEGPICPSLQLTTVEPDGSYSLTLPVARRATWQLAAFVLVGQSFMLGPTQSVASPAAQRSPVDLTVSARIVGLRVVDDQAQPFPEGTAAVMALPTGEGEWSVASADEQGDVLLLVDPTLEYSVNAFATNTGWPDPWIADDGTEFHFSEGIIVLGSELPEGHVFTVAPPVGEPSPEGTLVRVVGPDGSPFPAGTAGVQACAGPGWPEPCTHHVVASDTDGDGNVHLVLDPDLEYHVNGFATDTGWPDPWIADDGTEFHFSEGITVLGSELPEGHVFTVAPPG
jgi:hypothetical protein